MAMERKRIMGEIAAWQVCELIGRITGEQLIPSKINPYQLPEPVTPEMIEIKKMSLAAGLKAAVFGGQ